MKTTETGTGTAGETGPRVATSATRAALAAQLTGRTNRLFYVVVLVVALIGSSTAAQEWLFDGPAATWHLPVALVAVTVYELGAVAVSRFADQRRRLGERALVARAASAALAGGAIAAQALGHDDAGPAAFFAGVSATGYVIYLLDAAAARRDAMRRDGKLADTPPAYGPIQWAFHPLTTRRARSLALINAEQRLQNKNLPSLGRAASLEAAREQVRAERRLAAIQNALRDRIATGVDPTMAKIAVNTYSLPRVADGIAEAADYPALTRIITAELVPARLVKLDDPAAIAPSPAIAERPATVPAETAPPAETAQVAGQQPADGAVPPAAETGPAGETGSVPPRTDRPHRIALDPVPRPLAEIIAGGPLSDPDVPETVPVPDVVPAPPTPPATGTDDPPETDQKAADQGGTDGTETDDVLAGVEDKLLPFMVKVIDAHGEWATTVLMPPRHPDALNVPKIMTAAGTGSKAYGVAIGRHLRQFAANPKTVEAALRSRSHRTATVTTS